MVIWRELRPRVMQKQLSVLCIAAGFLATPAGSQVVPNGAEILFTSAGRAKLMLSELEKKRPPKQPFISTPVVRVGTYEEDLELNVGTATAAVHEQEVEFLYVVKGSATLVIGGSLQGSQYRAGATVSSARIKGGVGRKVSQGDFIAVPVKTAHGFTRIDGEIAVISLHLPAQ
jgi:mannose-6-phosphate isomerase-like protein (cupin superfamily)